MEHLNTSYKYSRLTSRNLETHIYYSYMDKFNSGIMTKLFEDNLLSQNNETVNLEQHIKNMNDEYKKQRNTYIANIRCYK